MNKENRKIAELYNTRRYAGLSPHKKSVRKEGRGFFIISMILIFLLALGSMGFLSTMEHSSIWVTRHSINVDGNPDDWAGTVPQNPDSGAISNGEYVWNDSIGDERDDFAIVPDGDLSDWNESFLVSHDNPGNDSRGADITGANITSLYVAWNTLYLYIYFNTSNRAGWDVAYGIGMDTKTGGYYGTPSTTDAWGRNISFSGHGIDYEIYFWFDSTINNITSADICVWNDTSSKWDYYDFENLNDDATVPDMAGANFANVSSTGLSYIEMRLPWNGLNMSKIPSQLNISAWVTGGSDSSAVDTIPDDVSVIDNGTGEWTDHDSFSSLKNVVLNSTNLARDVRVDLTGFRITADYNYIYILAKFLKLDIIGKDGAPAIMITMDKNASNTDIHGNTYFSLYSETEVNGSGYANWEYQIVIDLSRSVAENEKINGTGSALDIYNISWVDVSDNHSYFVVNKTNNTVEGAIYIPTLENDGTPLSIIRFEVGIVRANGFGDSWDPTKGGGDGSDVLDCITTTGPNTWDEVSDGYIDYYVEINIGDIIPESIFPVLISSVLVVAWNIKKGWKN